MGWADFSHPDAGASTSYRREMVHSRVKVLVSYILRAVGDLEKNFQVGANTDPREYPGSQSGLWDRQVAGDGG